MNADRARRGLAIVTGGAGGLGSAVARRLSQDGFDLLLCDLERGPLEAVSEELADGGQTQVLAADVASPGFTAELKAAIAGRPVAAVVHCAGLSPSMADAGRILQVNYDASAELVETVRDVMAPGGCVVLIASIAGYWPQPAEVVAAIEDLRAGGGSSTLRRFATTSREAYHTNGLRD